MISTAIIHLERILKSYFMGKQAVPVLKGISLEIFKNEHVAIARALVNNPSLILADEPTGNLDTKTSIEIMEIFNKIQAAGNTVVLVTHEEDISNYAHRVVRLRDGMIETDKRREGQHAS